MIRAEWKRILSEGLAVFIVFSLILLSSLITGMEHYTAPAIQLALLLYASFSGWSVFRRERNGAAMEYVLSLPVSRPKLLLIKTAPRLILLLMIFQICRLAAGILPRLLFPEIPGFSFLFFAFFAVSASFSLIIRNFPAAFFLTASLAAGLTVLTAVIDGEMINPQVAGRAGWAMLIIPLVFVFLFPKFDLKPRKHFSLRFFGYSFLIITGIFGIRWFGVERNWYYHLMTDEGGIYRMSGSRAEYIHENGVLRMNECFWPLAEKGPYLYLQDRMARRHDNQDIFILDKTDQKLRLYHKTEPGWRTAFSGPLYTSPVIKDTLFILQRNYSLNRYRVTGLGGSYEGTYPLDTVGIGPGGLYMLHVSEFPLRFWVKDRQRVIIFSEEGRVEKELEADSISAWGNKLLVFRKGTLSLFRAGEQIDTLFEMEGRYRKVLRRYGSELQEKVLLRNGGDPLIFSFDDESLVRTAANRNFFYYQVIGDRFYLVYLAPGGVALDIYQGDKFIERKILETDLGRFRQVLVFKKGVVISNRRNYEKVLF